MGLELALRHYRVEVRAGARASVRPDLVVAGCSGGVSSILILVLIEQPHRQQWVEGDVGAGQIPHAREGAPQLPQTNCGVAAERGRK